MQTPADILAYNAWRRYRQFKKGFDAGIAAASFHLEQMHRQNKHIHKFYLFASESVRKLK